MFWDCAHTWEVIDKEVLPSPYEQAAATCKSLKVGKIDAAYFQKKYICVVQCTVCGCLKKIVEVNPE